MPYGLVIANLNEYSAVSRAPLAVTKGNRTTEDQSIVNTDRPIKWRRGNAGRDLPKKRARGTRRIGRESTRSPWSERHGGWTRAASDLYPHQWSWDSGFIAIGLAHLDTGRAARELLRLFQHQWKTGKVPHIVFNPEAPPDSYFPGAEHWACAATSPEAPPAPPYTSCLCQPPTHAIAAHRIWEVASNGRARAEATAFLRDIYPGLLSWHRYLLVV
jgi:glycogen debranching enzyme